MKEPEVSRRPYIGIAGLGFYLPRQVMTSADMARESGLPEWVIREKFGIKQKYMAGPDEHPNQMAVWAAEACLQDAGIDAEEIDVVLCTTEEWKEYLLWTAGIDLAHRIGARRAWALDLHMRCCTTIAAMQLARDLMWSNEDIRTVLIAGGYSVGHRINLKNHRTSFMFNIAAGAGAMLLRKGHAENVLLGTHLITDGSMSRHVIIPASGTVEHPTDAAVREGRFYFDLVEPEAMKERLNAVSMPNWLHCIDEALRKSGPAPDGRPYTRADIDYLNMILVKPSAHREMLDHLGLSEEQSVYLDEFGHIGEQDSILSMIEGRRRGRLKPGDLMVVVAAGIGYVWGAACVRWGPIHAGEEQREDAQ